MGARRYAAPHLRDVLLDRGVLAETLETATSGRGSRRCAPRSPAPCGRARRARTPPLVLCHVSHLYPDGASLYFTVLAARQLGPGRAVAGRQRRRRRCDRAGGTTSPTTTPSAATMRRGWQDEVGPAGLEPCAPQGALDPHGIMNPGVLLWR